jgi:hypothetical protein
MMTVEISEPSSRFEDYGVKRSLLEQKKERVEKREKLQPGNLNKLRVSSKNLRKRTKITKRERRAGR